MVKAVMLANTINGGVSLGEKGISNSYFANNQLIPKDNTMPVKVDNVPSIKYSKPFICKICLRFAPNVLNRTLSLTR